MVIRIYIDQEVSASSGDKVVVGNQMKTVISRVMTGRNECETGDPIDLIFGNTSVEERKVYSPKLISTTTVLLEVLSKHIRALSLGETHARAK